MSEKPETFDWVSALSACSVGDVFERLRSQVKSDVEAREAMRQQASAGESHYAFRFMSRGLEFIAVVEGHKIHHAVIFALSVPSRSITVRDDHDVVICSATTTINDDGECRLKVNGEERELWQFRKDALEAILFGVY